MGLGRIVLQVELHWECTSSEVVTKVRSELGTLGMATIVELRVVQDCRKIAHQKVGDE